METGNRAFEIHLAGFPALLFLLFLLLLPLVLRYVIRYMTLRRRINTLKGRTLTIAQYDSPPDIPPAFFGTIVDNRTSMHDMFATLLSLHNKGLFSISYDSRIKDYVIALTNNRPAELLQHELYI